MYTVQPGDTLSAIARHFQTTVQALVEANADRYPSLRTNPSLLQVGWILDIPDEYEPQPPPPDAGDSYVGLRFGMAERRRGGQVADGVIEQLQLDLLALGYYGIRFGVDGQFNANVLGALVALKYDLANVYHVPGGQIGYPQDPTSPGAIIEAGAVDANTAGYIRQMVAGQPLNGLLPWLLPTRDDVADRDLTLADFVRAEAERGAWFPAPLFLAILGKESGGDHFDTYGNVKYGVDWVGYSPNSGYSFRDRVNFNPNNEQAPWINSRGWGLTQYTPFRVHDLPRPMPDYVLSIGANLRTAIDLFRGKFRLSFSKQRDCTFPERGNCPKCLVNFDPSTYSADVQAPCSWLAAVWAYNGWSPSGFAYMQRVVNGVRALARDLDLVPKALTFGPRRPAPARPKTWQEPNFAHPASVRGRRRSG
jgi:hypothetical protein